MEYLAELLDHLQQAIGRGESHAALALKVQNIRAELARAAPPAPRTAGEGEKQ